MHVPGHTFEGKHTRSTSTSETYIRCPIHMQACQHEKENSEALYPGLRSDLNQTYLISRNMKNDPANIYPS